MMKMSLAFLSVFCCCGTLLGGVIADHAESVTYRQEDGTEIVLRKKPRRTVICFASLTQVWYAAGGKAVGIPDVKSMETLPEDARKLPIIGAVTIPNPEKVFSLAPDLVLLNYKLPRHRALAELLRNNKIDAVCLSYRNYADFAELMNLFCLLNGSDIKQNTTAQKIGQDIDSICRQANRTHSPSVAVVFAATAGFSLETPESNTGMIVRMLHGNNIIDTKGRGRMKFSYEQFLLSDPDVVLIVPMGDEKALQEKFRTEIMSQPAWKKLSASGNNRIHFLPPELFLYQPGTRYPEAFRFLAKLLYPDQEFQK